jgi:hypothetical protein
MRDMTYDASDYNNDAVSRGESDFEQSVAQHCLDFSKRFDPTQTMCGQGMMCGHGTRRMDE